MNPDFPQNNNRLFEGLVVKLTQLVNNIGDETFLDIFFAGPIVAHVLCAAMGMWVGHSSLKRSSSSDNRECEDEKECWITGEVYA